MGSRGSVIPFFLNEKKKGVIPITDERMTRFNITLDEGVNFVISSFDRMWGGELFVPNIPSYRITDLSEAIAPNLKIKIIGIRPGEKLHEEMITVTDSLKTIEFKDYFVIIPSMKLWSTEKFINESSSEKGTPCEDGFSYNSGSNSDFLSTDEIKKLISQL